MRFWSIGIVAVALLVGTSAEARNTPCSGKKGGVKACSGDKFICNDGSISASERSCSAEGGASASNGEAGGLGGGKGKSGRRR